MFRPKDVLLDGVKILDLVLVPKHFRFLFREEGKGSGGEFAWGEFVHGNRRLEVHLRLSLGLVRYYVGNQSASHESYMRELRVWDQYRYPGFSSDPAAAFRDLVHDLGFADDFLSGSAEVLCTAAAREASGAAEQSKREMARYFGDERRLEQLRSRFHDGNYTQVVLLAESLKYPEHMTESELRMVEIARKRTLR